MDEARSLRGNADDKDARQQQSNQDADSVDHDAERSRTEAAGYAAEAASQRQEADALETQTEGFDQSDEISILRGRAEDNDLHERDAIQAAEASEVRAQQLRDAATGYGDEASGLRSDADTAEAQSQAEAEDELSKTEKVIIAERIVNRLDER